MMAGLKYSRCESMKIIPIFVLINKLKLNNNL